MSSPGTAAPTSATQIPPTPMPANNNSTGLINTTPTAAAQTSAQTPDSLGSNPVTPYNASQATTTNATATPTSVPTNATVSSQLNDIIASGSPLMQQAETNAKNQMNQRGLINSSQAITAGQSAVIAAATPIAQQDAATYAAAAQQTAQAQNAASLQNSQQANATSQFNAGQTNAAASQAQQISGQETVQGATNAVNKAIADLQSQTNLTSEQMQTASQQIIAQIQANTALTNQDKVDLSNQVIAQMNNAEALQAIQAQGSVNEQIAQIQGQFGQLTQSDQAAQQFYTQSLANLANIVNNTNLSDEQKSQALNDGVQELNAGLAAISAIASTPGVQSTLNFS